MYGRTVNLQSCQHSIHGPRINKGQTSSTKLLSNSGKDTERIAEDISNIEFCKVNGVHIIEYPALLTQVMANNQPT